MPVLLDLDDIMQPPASSKAPSISATARQQVAAMRKRDARGRRTMVLIYAALVDLIEERSFERITVDDIAQRAGVGRTTFYRHYADKEALIEEVARTEITRIARLVIPIENKENSLPSCRSLVTYVNEHRKLWSILLTGGAAAAMRHKFIELAIPDPRSSRAVPRHGIPVDLSASCGVAATVEVLTWWLKNYDRATVEQVADYINRLAVRPGFDPPHRCSAT